MSSRTVAFHHLMKSLILFGFAMYIARLVKTEDILLYIAPRMVDYVKWSAIGLYAVAVYQTYQAIRSFLGAQDDCGCGDHSHAPSRSVLKNTIVYGLFLFPLLMGFLLPDTTMGSSLAAKKGMNLSSSSSVRKENPSQADNAVPPGNGGPEGGSNASGSPSGAGTAAEDASLDELFPSDRFTFHYANHAKQLYREEIIRVPEESFIETLTSVDLYLDQFVGKKLEITGFVYRQEDMKANQFVVGRFSIQCCSADAAPFGVLAEYDRANQFATDSWVTVTGTIEKTVFHEMEIMQLKVERIAKAEPAASPYVYPNYDFGL